MPVPVSRGTPNVQLDISNNTELPSRNVLLGFVPRALSNLSLIDRGEGHAATQLYLTLYAVVLKPLEKGTVNLAKAKKAEIFTEHCSEWATTGIEPTNLDRVLDLVSNAIAHADVRFETPSDKDAALEMADLSFVFKDRPDKFKQPGTVLRIKADELRSFLKVYCEALVTAAT